MAVLSEDLTITRAEGPTRSYPAAADVIYKGALVGIVNGYAAPLTDGAKFIGVARFQCDNSSGSAGDKSVEVWPKVDVVRVLANVDKYMIGAYVYAINDTDLSLAPLATPVGKVSQVDGYDSGSCLIEFDADLNRQVMGGGNGYFLDFRLTPSVGGVAANNSGSAYPWIQTSVNGVGIVDVVRTRGEAYHGGLSIVPDTADNDSESLQIMGELFKMDTTTKPVFFGTKVQVATAEASDFIWGLAITDSALLAGMTDGITFRVADASGIAKLYIEKDSTETASGTLTTLVDATDVSLGFIYNGTNVIPYVNGVAGTALAVTNLPDDENLTPVIEYTAGAATSGGCIVRFLDAYQLV